MEQVQTQNSFEDFHGKDFGNITDIIWDGDNTIWDWMKYAVEAYEAMAKAIAHETNIAEDDVVAAMKKFYTKAGTIEDAGLIQGMVEEGFFKSVPDFDQNKLIEKAQKAFTHERKKHLKVYPGIHKVIKTVAENGIRNRILTDAPSGQAGQRIRRSKINPFLSQVNAQPARAVKDLPPKFLKREQRGLYSLDFEITEVPWEKPYSNLEEILKMTREQIRKHVVIIGDNDKKDMELARLYGCRGIHAVYGETHESLLKRLLRFAPERVAKKNVALKGTSGTDGKEQHGEPAADHRGKIIKVTDPYEILKILGIKSKRKW